MRRGGQKKRRDANEPEIIAALKALGARVYQVSGSGLPDLIVQYQGREFCLEVKTAKGKRTDAQEISEFRVVRSPADAVEAVRTEQKEG